MTEGYLTLKELGLEENTILVFMTDNGTAGLKKGKGFNAGMRGGKADLYDGGHRVPCFIRRPGGGIKAGMDIDRLTAHIDLMPTFMEICGIDKRENVKLDGKSLVGRQGILRIRDSAEKCPTIPRHLSTQRQQRRPNRRIRPGRVRPNQRGAIETMSPAFRDNLTVA